MVSNLKADNQRLQDKFGIAQTDLEQLSLKYTSEIDQKHQEITLLKVSKDLA